MPFDFSDLVEPNGVLEPDFVAPVGGPKGRAAPAAGAPDSTEAREGPASRVPAIAIAIATQTVTAASKIVLARIRRR